MMIKQGLKTFKKPALLLSASLGLWLGVSCQDDMLAERQPVITAGDEISFAVVEDSTWTAISRSEKKISRHFITMIGKDSVFLQVIEEKNRVVPLVEQKKDSRSASFTGSNLNSFYLNAYYNNEDEFMKDQEVTKNDDGDWEYAPIKYWPNNPGDVISFYGHAIYETEGVNKCNLSDYSIDKENLSASFSYVLPGAETDSQKDDAINQPDLIFAIASNQTKPTVTDKVELVFHHALSAILFKMGSIPDGVQITDISLKSVSTSGNCDYQVGKNEDGEEILDFDWTDTNSEGTYTQTFNATKDVADEGEVLLSNGEKLFMMIPQQLNKAVLEVKFKVGEKIHALESDLDLDGFPTSWKADMKYTYVISTSTLVDVEIDDQCTQTIKSDVKIQNTGFSPAYIRAAIVGYWVNETNIIVKQWSFEDTLKGTIDWNTESQAYWEIKEGSSQWSDYWEKRDDGFYYYKHLVYPAQYTYPLFDKYILKEEAPFNGAELKVNIVVQAVDEALEW